jgi:hypothetical protein
MKTTTRLSVLAALALATAACSSHSHPPPPPPVMVPPEIDLKAHEVIGVITFDSEGKDALGPMATKKFTEMARRDQGLVRIVPLGSRSDVLRSLGAKTLDPAALQAVGQKRGVQTILVGTVKLDNVKPSVRVATDLRAAGMTAHVRATLDVQMVETASGASLWNSTASATRDLGDVAVVGGQGLTFGHDDPERAYGDLMDNLVEQTTRPFRARWERR